MLICYSNWALDGTSSYIVQYIELQILDVHHRLTSTPFATVREPKLTLLSSMADAIDLFASLIQGISARYCSIQALPPIPPLRQDVLINVYGVMGC